MENEARTTSERLTLGTPASEGDATFVLIAFMDGVRPHLNPAWEELHDGEEIAIRRMNGHLTMYARKIEPIAKGEG